MAHSKRCLAAAIVAAIENVRDIEGLSDVGFRLIMQDNPLHIAEGYLGDGTKTCECSGNIKACGCYANDALCPHLTLEDENLMYDPDDPYGGDHVAL